MEHKDSIPYYHTNIRENTRKIHDELERLIKRYGEITDGFVDAKDIENEDDRKVHLLSVQWEDVSLQREYTLQQFAGVCGEMYGYHLMLKTVEAVGEEFEVYVDVFSPEEGDSNKIDYRRQPIQHTVERQRREDEWWEANKKLSSDGSTWFAINTDITTDDIAYELELLVDVVMAAESFIREANSS